MAMTAPPAPGLVEEDEEREEKLPHLGMAWQKDKRGDNGSPESRAQSRRIGGYFKIRKFLLIRLKSLRHNQILFIYNGKLIWWCFGRELVIASCAFWLPGARPVLQRLDMHYLTGLLLRTERIAGGLP